jgi:hypothetical protein
LWLAAATPVEAGSSGGSSGGGGHAAAHAPLYAADGGGGDGACWAVFSRHCQARGSFDARPADGRGDVLGRTQRLSARGLCVLVSASDVRCGRATRAGVVVQATVHSNVLR